MSNLGLERYLESLGLRLYRTPVGDRHVVDYMRDGGHNLGGEQSGHIILSDYSTTGDGVLAALQALHLLARHDRPASRVFDRFTPVPQITQSVGYESGMTSPLEDEAIRTAIANSEAELGAQGRLVVRASGTEPKIRVMAEGDDAGLVQQTVEQLCAEIEKMSA
jgi:phosphoglucosamine mutase